MKVMRAPKAKQINPSSMKNENPLKTFSENP
jgi:hypothetical protein